MNISVFLISTPSQAFFLDKAGEVIEPKSVLIITTITKAKKESILKYLNKYNWSDIIHWKIPHPGKKSEYWKLALIQLRCLKFVALNKSKIDKIFIGSYANIFHKNLIGYFPENVKINLIYDGLQVLAVSENRQKDNGKFKSLPLLYRLLCYRNIKVQNLTYVTPFKFNIPSNDSIEVFQMDKNRGRVKYDQEKIYFIGQPLENIKAVTQEYYLETLDKFITQKESKKVFYIPHPRESESKIELISKMCEIFRPGKVFEEYYIEAEDRPRIVASFYSSVLLNLYAIDENINLISIHIPFSQLLNPRFKEILKPVYSFFDEISGNRFQIIFLS